MAKQRSFFWSFLLVDPFFGRFCSLFIYHAVLFSAEAGLLTYLLPSTIPTGCSSKGVH
jgi:hypothetical protein